MNSFDLDRRTLGLLLGVLVAAVAATALLTHRSAAPVPVAAPMVSVASSPSASTPTASAPTTAASPEAEVVVEVVGKVRRPQVVTLPDGSRVLDAVRAAGGAKPGVDTTDQNLARLLVDGEQIRIGLDAAAGPAPTSSPGSAGGQIDINTATAAQLEEIPGVGPVLAQRIIMYRDQNGGFASVEQLTEVSGIGEATFAQMQAMVTVSGG